jgi:hypothetical protein
MKPEIPTIWEKSENHFHFYFSFERDIYKTKMKLIHYRPLKKWHLYCTFMVAMLTRRDILTELNRMGVKKPSLLKNYLRDFERYVGTYYDFKILKTNKKLNHQPNENPESLSENIGLSVVTQKISNVK